MSKKQTNTDVSESRRKFIKTAAYATPVVLTMAVAPGVHAIGSQRSTAPITGNATTRTPAKWNDE